MAESHREEIAKLEALYAGNPGGRVFVHLADAYRKAGEHERARRILDEGLARHPDSASGYVVLGRVLADMQIVDEAEVAFRRVLALDGGNLVALRWLGDLARQDGRNNEAIGHYRELLARNPSNEEVRDLVEIVEREVGVGPAADQDAAGQESTEETVAWEEPEPDEPEPDEPVAADGFAVQEPLDQVGAVPDAELSPLSAAPGQTGDAEAVDVEFGLVEISVLAEEQESHAVDRSASAGTESGEREAEDAVIVDTPGGEIDEALMQLNETVRNDEAGPIELHLLDPSFAGEEVEEVEGVDIDLSFEEPATGEDFADDEFIADLISAGNAEPPTDEVTLDVMIDASLQLPDGDTRDVTESAPDGMPGQPGEPVGQAPFDVTLADDTGTLPEYEAPASAQVWSAEAVTEQESAEVDAAGNVQAGAPAQAEWMPESAAPEEPGVTPVGEPGMLDRLDSLAADFADDVVEAEPEPISGAEAAETSPGSGFQAGAAAGSEPSAVDAVPAAGSGAQTEAGPVTETMAELYRTQGFHERAADVYRALLRQRPFDLRLSAKLSEAEADAAAAAAARSAALAPGPDDEATGEVWLRGVGAPWDAGVQDPSDSASPYGWTPEPEDAPPAEPIGSYLRDLVGWRTAGRRWAEAPPPAPPAQETTSWGAAEEPWATPEPSSDLGSGAANLVDPWGESAGAQPGAPQERTAADGEIAAATAADTPADPWPRGETETPSDPWGGAATVEAPADQGDETWAPTERTPESRATAAPSSGSEEDTEDEDLEMFRSWLQSLKK